MTGSMEKIGPNRIEKQIELRASPARVWQAIANADEFGTWFGANFDGAFAEGTAIRGQLTVPGYGHLTMELVVERIEPQRYFSYRWHPYAVDPAIDYSEEPTTLVEFFVERSDGGTTLRVVESGFAHLPLGRRSEAFRMNDGGWSEQIKNIEAHISRSRQDESSRAK